MYRLQITDSRTDRPGKTAYEPVEHGTYGDAVAHFMRAVAAEFGPDAEGFTLDTATVRGPREVEEHGREEVAFARLYCEFGPLPHAIHRVVRVTKVVRS